MEGWLGTLRVRGKLMLLVGAVAGLLGLAAVAALGGMIQMRATFERGIAFEHAALGVSETRGAFMRQHQEMKDFLLRGSNRTDYQAHLTGFQAQGVRVMEARTRLMSMESSLSAEDRAILRKFDENYHVYIQAFQQARAAYDANGGGQQAAADAIMRGKDGEIVQSMFDLGASLDKRGDVLKDQADATSTMIIMVSIVVVLVALLVAGGFSRYLAGLIVRPVRDLQLRFEMLSSVDLPAMVTSLHSWASGNTSAQIILTMDEIQVNSSDEFGEMTTSYNQMVSGLRSVSNAFESVTSNLETLRRATAAWRDRRTS